MPNSKRSRRRHAHRQTRIQPPRKQPTPKPAAPDEIVTCYEYKLLVDKYECFLCGRKLEPNTVVQRRRVEQGTYREDVRMHKECYAHAKDWTPQEWRDYAGVEHLFLEHVIGVDPVSQEYQRFMRDLLA